jgi:hypothetical protein
LLYEADLNDDLGMVRLLLKNGASTKAGYYAGNMIYFATMIATCNLLSALSAKNYLGATARHSLIKRGVFPPKVTRS